MAKLKVTLNHATVRRLLLGEGEFQAVDKDVERRARAVAAQAGPGMEVEDAGGQTRARWIVYTATPEAKAAEATDRALTRAIDAGR